MWLCTVAIPVAESGCSSVNCALICIVLSIDACSSELEICLAGTVSPRAILTCNKNGKKESCSLTCASKARFLPGKYSDSHPTHKSLSCDSFAARCF